MPFTAMTSIQLIIAAFAMIMGVVPIYRLHVVHLHRYGFRAACMGTSTQEHFRARARKSCEWITFAYRCRKHARGFPARSYHVMQVYDSQATILRLDNEKGREKTKKKNNKIKGENVNYKCPGERMRN